MRLLDALARFQTQLQADGRSPHTNAQYRRHVRRFGAWLEAEGLPAGVAALEPEHVAVGSPSWARARLIGHNTQVHQSLS